MLTFRLSSIITRGSGLLSLLFLFFTAEQLEHAYQTEVNATPRDLLFILAEIERDLGDNITDPDLVHALEHGGVVDGAQRALDELTKRYWQVHNFLMPADENDQNEREVEDHKEHHKIESTNKEDDLSDPIQPPYEVPDQPGSVNSHNYQWIFNPVNRCKRDKTKFLIIIKSKEENYQVRHTIRETWCAPQPTVTCMFLLGRDTTLEKEKVKLEATHYKDLLMEEMSDDDDIRKVIMGLKWSIKYCTSATHVLKTNDNVWVNIPRFMDYFDTNGAIGDHVFGGKCIIEQPDRDPKSIRYLPVEIYASPFLPAICSETGYIFSKDMAATFYEESRNLAPLVRHDDIYFGILASQLKLMPQSISGFNYGKYMLQRACEYKNDAFTIRLSGSKKAAGLQSTIKSLNERIQKCG